MLNILDVVIAVLMAVYLLKNFGGPNKIVKAIAILIVALLIFGVVARLVVDLPLPDKAKETMRNSYFFQLSNVMIRWVYPAIENNAPKVNEFIKTKIIAAPTPEVTAPQVALPTKVRIKLPEISAEF